MEIRRCNRCGLVFLWPRPSPEELASFYSEEYREEYGDPARSQQYLSDLDEGHLRLRRVLPFVRSDSRLLDFGSGSGAFLDLIRRYVKEAVGVELHEEYRRSTVSELKIRIVANLEELLAEAFDVVTMFHVIEHVENPVALLRCVRRTMKKDALLLIEVPNVEDALVSIYRVSAYLRFYYQKAHLYYFSKGTLGKALKQAGFTATIEAFQRYDLSNHIRWMLSGQPGGQAYYNDILPPCVNDAYAEALARAGYSDTLWAVARQEN